MPDYSQVDWKALLSLVHQIEHYTTIVQVSISSLNVSCVQMKCEEKQEVTHILYMIYPELSDSKSLNSQLHRTMLSDLTFILAYK